MEISTSGSKFVVSMDFPNRPGYLVASSPRLLVPGLRVSLLYPLHETARPRLRLKVLSCRIWTETAPGVSRCQDRSADDLVRSLLASSALKEPKSLLIPLLICRFEHLIQCHQLELARPEIPRRIKLMIPSTSGTPGRRV